MLNIGDMLDERYEITGKIGQGGMSYIYRALDTKLGREVAVKVLKEDLSADEEFIERFKNEARSAAKLTHPNIVAVYDIVDHDDTHYIAMELVEGISLKNYIAKKGVLSNKETISIAMQAASGISEAHKNGIIHRDIKPQNIMISKDGKIKVADFGIALAATEDAEGNHLVIGSAHYIAPEQARTGQTDARSDIYSLGISMYEMITGMLPFNGEDTVSIVVSHIQNVLIPPSVYNHDIYPALNDIIIKAAKKDPEERYQTADELIEDLKRAVNEPSGHFVKLYDSVTSSEAAPSASLVTEAEADNKETKEQGSSAKDLDKEETEAAIEKAGKNEDAGESKENLSVTAKNKPDEDNDKNRIIKLAALVIFVLILIIFSLVMIKKAGDVTSSDVVVSESETGQDDSQDANQDETEMDYTISISGDELMPDLIGLDINTARTVLSEMQLSMDSSAEKYSDTVARGLIMEQDPASGELTTSDSMVYVTISKGSVLDDLQNNTIQDATDKLQSEGYIVDNDVDQQFSDVIEEGLVCGYTLINENGQEESASEDAAMESTLSASSDSMHVRLSVSMGSRSEYGIMPDLVGLTRANSILELGAEGLQLGKVTALNTSEYDLFTVAGQSVAPGEYVKKGTAIDISVSVGDSGTIADGTDITDMPEASIIETDTGDSTSETELSDNYYYGSIDTSCVIGQAGGPGSAENINVGIRLRQRDGGSDEYTQLIEPIPVASGSRIPVSFRNIRGAYGITEGYVEVYNTDTMEIYSSYRITFAPV